MEVVNSLNLRMRNFFIVVYYKMLTTSKNKEQMFCTVVKYFLRRAESQLITKPTYENVEESEDQIYFRFQSLGCTLCFRSTDHDTLKYRARFRMYRI